QRANYEPSCITITIEEGLTVRKVLDFYSLSHKLKTAPTIAQSYPVKIAGGFYTRPLHKKNPTSPSAHEVPRVSIVSILLSLENWSLGFFKKTTRIPPCQGENSSVLWLNA
ncbi:MAG: hypothetical protein JXD19_11530, partial [Deltaproteobacteria bacterium]|nr:hypothetical protein [Deltaproteobacteria bacterium]